LVFKKTPGIGLILLLLSAGLLLAAETLKVRVKSTKLRSSPKFYAGSVASLQFGESLEKITAQGDWIQAKTTTGTTGWIHSSAVTVPKFSLTAGKTAQEETTADEVALAGKGFNQQVEEEYRKNSDLDYTWVDRMAQIQVTEAEMERFFREGKLGEFGGGQ
jgi:uncharacterized protein YgiM (DUF1202 family)